MWTSALKRSRKLLPVGGDQKYSNQGSQFTCHDFTKLLKDNGIAISMDGKGCWRDNVFVERQWLSVKYEEIYLKAYASVSEARSGIGK
jgi:putative transposase